MLQVYYFTTANCGPSKQKQKYSQHFPKKASQENPRHKSHDNVTNIELYTKPKTEEWITTTQRRRLNPNTPTILALYEDSQTTQRKTAAYSPSVYVRK